MQFKKILTSLLAGACVFSLSACGNDPEPPPSESNVFYESQETIAELFNAAIDKLNDVGSYKMVGSLVSVAEVLSSGEMTNSMIPIDCTYQDGSFTIDSLEANIDPHSTYFDGERYYYTLHMNGNTINCFSTANDHVDYAADGYLRKIDAEILFNPQIIELENGSKDISFDMPFAIYDSPAMIDHLGTVVDDEHQAKSMSVSANIDSDGYLTHFIISFINDTAFGDDSIHQEIVANMELSDYATAVITPPDNLDTYEDWSEDIPEMSTEGMGEHSPEDVE